MTRPTIDIHDGRPDLDDRERDRADRAYDRTRDAPVVLELDDVVKEYPGSPPVRAVDRVSLRVPAGELVAVVGPSGSGKSTLLHLMGALDRPSAGRVRVAGIDVGELADSRLSALRSQEIGFVFQRFHLLDGVSALDNVASGLLYRGIPRSERRRRAADALERVGLAARMRHRPSQLSGGESQRVAIARAIVGSPPLVLADEPTGNLDSATGLEVIDLLRGLQAGGTTIVVITHDHELAVSMPRRVEVRDGRVWRDVHDGPGRRDAPVVDDGAGVRS